MAKKKKKILKYFELPLDYIEKWRFIDYMLFVIESLYTTVFPFIGGMLLVYRGELIWLGMLVLPIYLHLNIERKNPNKKRHKRLFVK